MSNFFTKIFKSARGRLWLSFFIILFLSISAGIFDAGPYYNKGVDWLSSKTNYVIKLPHFNPRPFRLGLDLLGGTHLVYRADMSKVASADQKSALDGVRDVIERRVNFFGVSEPIVQTSMSAGEPRVIVELAGVKDVKEAIKMIGETPLLEFKEEDDSLRELTPEEKQKMDEYNKKAEEKLKEVLEKLKNNEDFSELAKKYSDDTKTKDNGGELGWLTRKDAPNLVSKVEDLAIGEYTKEPIKTSNGYDILKLEDKRQKTNPFDENDVEKEVKASHILLCYKDIEGCTNDLSKEEAYAKIKEIKKEATPENFAELAKKYSTGPSASKGGELGWFSRGMMVKPFEDTVFDNQEVGTISYVVETKFGYHLIYKEAERPIEEYKIARIFIHTLSEKEIIGDQNKWKNTKLTGKNLKKATVQFDPNDNSPLVGLEFDDEGTKLFAEITKRNVNKRLAIFLDGKAIVDVNGDGKISDGEVYAPVINEPILTGKAVISGLANSAKAQELARRLNAGALPVPIELISQQTVGASLGHESLLKSFKAGLIGLLLVALFMILYYRLAGLLAVFSLMIYGILVLFVFKIWPVTLSLSGLAGFILSIGMAVDANVLIFERLKEEFGDGKPLLMSIEEAFKRAMPSIIDGNVSTLITAFILVEFSTSIVKGFAITLIFGVSISMFSAIIITKIFLKLVSGRWLENHPWLLGLRK